MDHRGGESAGLAIYRSSVWSTRLDLLVTDPAVMVDAVRLLTEVLERVDALASRFRADSEISALHRRAGSGAPVRVGVDLFEAIGVAIRAARLTGGAVDPTVGSAMVRLGYDVDFSAMEPDLGGDLPRPARVPGWRSVVMDADRSTVALPAGTVLDLGATAKAWAADRAAGAIAGRLGCGALVSLGGDIAVGGVPPAGGFPVGIADSCDEPASQSVAVSSGGLATSGIAKRRWSLGGHPVHHLIDPATGLPVDAHWRTVSVAAGSCTDANVASTAAMVMGKDAVTWLEERHLPARLVPVRPGPTVTVCGWRDDQTPGRPGANGSGSSMVRAS